MQKPKRPSPAPTMHRVHLVHPDGSWVTCFLPLDADGQLDATRPKPWLLKTKWGSDMAYGELHVGARANRIEWSGDWQDSATSLGRAPLKVGAKVVIHDDDESSLAWTFVVADLSSS